MHTQTLKQAPAKHLFPVPFSGATLPSLPSALHAVPEIDDLDTARVALTEAERVIRDQEERIRQLESLAVTDELTGLLNRRGFTQALQRELLMARRDIGASGVLVMVDLDRFKSVNDMWGHGVGDDYLKTVSRALLQGVRTTDVVARIGGDEFAILFTRMNEETGQERLTELDQSFNARVMRWGRDSLPLRASFGLSPYCGTDAPETILAAADLKLYARKAQRQSQREKA